MFGLKIYKGKTVGSPLSYIVCRDDGTDNPPIIAYSMYGNVYPLDGAIAAGLDR